MPGDTSGGKWPIVIKEEDREKLRRSPPEVQHEFSFRMGLYMAYTLFRPDFVDDEQFEELSKELGAKWGDQMRRALAPSKPVQPPAPKVPEKSGFSLFRRSR
jgi:hypothetical protein